MPTTKPPSTGVRPAPPRLSWDEFWQTWAPTWEQGEHVAAISATGGGKTSLFRAILPRRIAVVGLISKKRDDTYSAYLRDGYERVTQWPLPKKMFGKPITHALLWPKAADLEGLYSSRPLFDKCLRDVYKDEGWTVVLDDLYWLANELKLTRTISALNFQVRSIDVTLVSGLQRPAWVPRSTWNQTKHLFMTGMSDDDDLRSLRGVAKASTIELRQWTDGLQKYEWLYCPQVAGEFPACIVKPPAPTEPLWYARAAG